MDMISIKAILDTLNFDLGIQLSLDQVETDLKELGIDSITFVQIIVILETTYASFLSLRLFAYGKNPPPSSEGGLRSLHSFIFPW